MTLFPFSLLSLRRIVSFVLLPTGWTIYLSRRTNEELFTAAFALFRSSADKLRIEIKINRQNDIPQVITHNAAERNELRTGVFVPIVQQQAVSTNTIGAALFDKGVDPFGLLRCDPDYNFTHLAFRPAELSALRGFSCPVASLRRFAVPFSVYDFVIRLIEIKQSVKLCQTRCLF